MRLSATHQLQRTCSSCNYHVSHLSRESRWNPAHDEYIFATFSGSISCFSTAPRTESDFNEAMGIAAPPPLKSSAISATATPAAPHPQPGVKLPGTNAPLSQDDAADAATSHAQAKPSLKKQSPPPPAAASSSFFSAIGEKLGLVSGSGRGDAPATAADAVRQQKEERSQSISSMQVRPFLPCSFDAIVIL